MVKEFGPKVLTRAMNMTMGRESLYTCAMLGITPELQRFLKTDMGFSDKIALAVGALAASTFSVTLTHPLDIIKTCMQGDIEKKKYKSAIKTGRTLCQEYGSRLRKRTMQMCKDIACKTM